ncbi:MAG: S8 family serine peptidase [Planctomycetota bacterium]
MSNENRRCERAYCQRLVLLLICQLSLLILLVMPAWAEAVLWKSGAVEFAPQTPAEIENMLTTANREVGGSRMVVQFDRPVDAELRQRMAAAGMQLQAYVGRNAFFATLDAQELDATALSQIEEVLALARVRPEWKLHPALSAEEVPAWARVGTRGDGMPIMAAYLLFHRDVDLELEGLPLVVSYGAEVRDVLESVNGLVIELAQDLFPLLAAEDAVQWIEPPLPKLSPTNMRNRARTGAGNLQGFPLMLDGSGVTVLVFDGGVARASHIDFEGRLIVGDSDGISNHATHVAGTIGGAGVADPSLRGMAPGCDLISYGFEWDSGGIFLYSNPGDIETDYTEAINIHGADIANNSIGTNTATNGFPCEITGDYGVTSNLIDTIVRGGVSNGVPFRIVWANGNERQTARCGDNFATTAPPATAKNHITVGALNANDDSMTSFSSWGPVDDGRMKPDICAPGCQSDDDFGVTSCSSSSDTAYTTMCGTSMSSPTVTGCAALLLQHYRNLYQGVADPRNSTLKIFFAHSAVDLGWTGPDYQYGYGSIRVDAAANLISTGRFLEGDVSQGAKYLFDVTVAPGTSEVKITMAWDDFPATPNVDVALVNDLDLLLRDPLGAVHYAWTLDPETPYLAAVQDAPNRRDNIEQVLVTAPMEGVWRVEVVGHNVPEGPQTFSLCSSVDVEHVYATGDMNCDGIVNAYDIDPFICAVSPECDYAAAWPDCDESLADANGDGSVDSYDIDAFIDLVAGG